MGWQRSSSYNRRSLIETAMFRYKTVIGRRLHALILSNQRTEAKVGCNVLNRMMSLHMPVSAGKQRMGRISKAGNERSRLPLVVDATSVIS